MRRSTADGLRSFNKGGSSLDELSLRGLKFWDVVVMYVTDPVVKSKMKEALEAQWHQCSPEEAAAKLAAPDVEVTNKSDKTEQIEKLKFLSGQVKQEFARVRKPGQLKERWGSPEERWGEGLRMKTRDHARDHAREQPPGDATVEGGSVQGQMQMAC